jgi:cystathionine beta-lyase
MEFDEHLGQNTRLQHFGEEEKIRGAVVPPIFQNSLFVFDTVEELFQAMLEEPAGPPHHYSRLGNPSVHLAEQKIAMLEGTEGCKLSGTGMGAIAMAIMSSIEQGSHVITLDTAYQPVRLMLTDYLSRFGVTTTFVDGICTDAIIDEIRPETSLIYLESPSSVLFRLQDLEAVAKAARQKGVTTVVDNTCATPLFQNPAKFGIDLVCHSATKYLGGHSDITAGAVCGSAERLRWIVKQEMSYLGSIIGPFPAWLLTRGMRTLPLRLKQHEAAGNEVASWLLDQPQVDRVHHLGLPSYPQRDLYRKQMRGSGGLFSFEPSCQEREKVHRFCEELRLFQIGISWGGFESLVVPLEIHPMNYPEPRQVVRLFVGLEDPADLIADLQQAFEAAEM